MTQGIFVRPGGARDVWRRPSSKKQVRELALASPSSVRLEETSLYPGVEFDGPLSDLPEGRRFDFVGPDPRRDRRFYGTITRKGDRVVVK